MPDHKFQTCPPSVTQAVYNPRGGIKELLRPHPSKLGRAAWPLWMDVMESVAFQIWATVSLLAHLADGSPITSLDVPLMEEEVPFFDEQDALLQNLQNELLKALNLSGIPLEEEAKVDPPEYMLELYNRFARDKTLLPSANIVRSFKNEGKSLDFLPNFRRSNQVG